MASKEKTVQENMDKILSALEKNKRALTVSEIEDATGLSRLTIYKHLKKLDGSKKITIVKYGNTCIYEKR